LRFPPRLVTRPIVSDLARRFDLEFIILRASVTLMEEGLLVLALRGPASACKAGVEYLEAEGVAVEPLSQDVVRNEDRCTQCGACSSVCPSGALAVEAGTMKVIFDDSKCIACEFCIRACPPRAMQVRF
jgi:ferredoxin